MAKGEKQIEKEKITVELPGKISKRDLLYCAYVGAQTMFEYYGEAAQKEPNPKVKQNYTRAFGDAQFFMDVFKDALKQIKSGR